MKKSVLIQINSALNHCFCMAHIKMDNCKLENLNIFFYELYHEPRTT